MTDVMLVLLISLIEIIIRFFCCMTYCLWIREIHNDIKLNGRLLVTWYREKVSEYIHYTPLSVDNQNNINRTILASGIRIV